MSTNLFLYVTVVSGSTVLRPGGLSVYQSSDTFQSLYSALSDSAGGAWGSLASVYVSVEGAHVKAATFVPVESSIWPVSPLPPPLLSSGAAGSWGSACTQRRERESS